MEEVSLSGFLSGFATAYFTLLAYQVLRQKDATRLQLVLGVIFVQWALFNLKDFLLTLHDYNDPTAQDLITLIDGLSLIGYTILLFEIICPPRWFSMCKLSVMLMPYIPFYIAYALYPEKIVILSYLTFLFLAGTFIFIYWLTKARKYARYIRESYSNIDEIDISWLRVVGWFFVSCQLIWVAISIVRNPWLDCLYYVLSIVLWQITLEHIMHHKPIIIEEQETTDVREYNFAETLPIVIVDEALYLNPTLSIKDLATRFSTNRTYLSDYFAHHLHITFYDYINQLRIEKKAMPLMLEHPEYTIETIALESGFQSASTFRRSFQKIKGITPGEFRKQHKKQ